MEVNLGHPGGLAHRSWHCCIFSGIHAHNRFAWIYLSVQFFYVRWLWRAFWIHSWGCPSLTWTSSVAWLGHTVIWSKIKQKPEKCVTDQTFSIQKCVSCLGRLGLPGGFTDCHPDILHNLHHLPSQTEAISGPESLGKMYSGCHCHGESIHEYYTEKKKAAVKLDQLGWLKASWKFEYITQLIYSGIKMAHSFYELFQEM